MNASNPRLHSLQNGSTCFLLIQSESKMSSACQFQWFQQPSTCKRLCQLQVEFSMDREMRAIRAQLTLELEILMQHAPRDARDGHPFPATKRENPQSYVTSWQSIRWREPPKDIQVDLLWYLACHNSRKRCRQSDEEYFLVLAVCSTSRWRTEPNRLFRGGTRRDLLGWTLFRESQLRSGLLSGEIPQRSGWWCSPSCRRACAMPLSAHGQTIRNGKTSATVAAFLESLPFATYWKMILVSEPIPTWVPWE